ncbi:MULTISPECIES: hypothetical protein [unclassified Streptomyces]|uniref:hypothetical protein n=1 Tax=unclassified Streptomyces TaxID=2593676 RepID=UPI000823D85A|nr:MULTISPECIES: hypothetical protein [unclassified Streptomyces]MYT96133.1 hypothetical protein [Streptomyces sp. SID8350]SCK46592.1 hypothetical protein YUWDRAFT_04028 [Streptomyces sp. AmelKG-D3]
MEERSHDASVRGFRRAESWTGPVTTGSGPAAGAHAGAPMGSSRAVLVRADARPLVLSAALPDALDPPPHP